MLVLIVQNQTHRAFTQFGGKLVRCLAHDAQSYSGVGASGKLGAVHPGSSHQFSLESVLQAFEGLIKIKVSTLDDWPVGGTEP